MTTTTKQRLADALRKAGAPAAMVARALIGAYDDYESDSPTPINDLVRELLQAGLDSIAKRAMSGEFDATKEEADAWFKREGKDLLS